MDTIIKNNNSTVLDNMTPEQKLIFFNEQPFVYYQNYVKGSISPYYTKELAFIGASEEFMELLNASEVYMNTNVTNATINDVISESGDFLFQLNNIANYLNIDMEECYNKILPELLHLKDNMVYNSVISVSESFGILLGTALKAARYPDPSYFESKYNMSLENYVKLQLTETLKRLALFIYDEFYLSLKDIMKYNLEKLDRRHSKDGNYYFGAGYSNTKTNGGNFAR